MKNRDSNNQLPRTSGNPASKAPIDESVIRQVRIDFEDEDGSLVAALISAFAENADTVECAATLSDMMAQTSLLQCVQQLRASAMMVGARQVSALCQELDAVDRLGDETRSRELLATLTQAIDVAKRALARIVPPAVATATSDK